MMYFPFENATYTVNGQAVSQSEFNSLLFPKLVILLFLAIGIVMLIKGIKIIFRNTRTKKHGERCYGRVLDVRRNGVYVNNVPMYKAQVMIYSNDEMCEQTVWEDIGYDPSLYPVGSFVKVLYYQGDINFDSESTQVDDMPNNTKEYLLSKTDFLLPNIDDNHIVVNGVRYVKEDSLYQNSQK